MNTCLDCGEVNPADIHTCSPQANRLDATVFVYRHKPTGNINALYHEDALDAAKRDDLEHLATLEPRLFIQAHYAKVSGAADPVLPSAGETTGPVSAAPTLREAAQQALEIFDLGILREEQHRRVEALRAALAEPDHSEQDLEMVVEPVQPVAVVNYMETGGNAGIATRIVEIDDPLRERLRAGTLLYTAPPQRKPLTEEEIAESSAGVLGLPHEIKVELARAIERAHGITGGSDE